MQRKPNKTIKQNKLWIRKKILIIIWRIILWWIIWIWITLFYLRKRINLINNQTNSYISDTQTSWIYVLEEERNPFYEKELTAYKFSLLNNPEIYFILTQTEYPRVRDYYPYSKDVLFNIIFSWNVIKSFNLVDPNNWNNLWNKISDINWLEYLTWEFYNLSGWSAKDSIYTKGDWNIHINNNTSSTFSIKLEDEYNHIIDHIILYPWEYYINRSNYNRYRLIIEKDPEYYKENWLLQIRYDI